MVRTTLRNFEERCANFCGTEIKGADTKDGSDILGFMGIILSGSIPLAVCVMAESMESAQEVLGGRGESCRTSIFPLFDRSGPLGTYLCK
jgi:hypothetical protein